jgi:SP family sugar:H+ symporter-like MFS transporter
VANTLNSTAKPVVENLKFVLLISCVATIGGFLFGFDSGVINGTVDGLQAAFKSDSAGTGFSVASMLLGCALGAFVAGNMADKIGRLKVLQISAVFFIISAFGSGIAETQFAFVIYRIIGGLAVGAASVIAPAYISEIAPARLRGALTSIQQIAIIVGLFCAFISNYFLAIYAGSSTAEFWMGFEAWRWMFWMELIPATVFLVALFFIPESPRYLVLAGRTDEAKSVLGRLFGNPDEKINSIQTSLDNANHGALGFSGLLEKGKVLKPVVWAGLGLAIFQQLVGINVVFYYGAVLWQAVGFAESDALLINIISGGVSILACLITLVLIDRVGRKPFLMLGSLGMSVCLIIMVVTFANASLDVSGNLDLGDKGTITLIAANTYVFFFNMSWGPVMWVMLGEMFPNAIRGTALAVSGLAQWGSNFLITITFPILLTGFGLAFAYGIYAACAVISIFFVYALVRETKGLELEKMT